MTATKRPTRGRLEPAVPAAPPANGRRVTMRQVAKLAGVSEGAASYALNGLPGVSPATRERVLQVAAELGWAPNPAARALSASRANAVGLAMVRAPAARTIDTYQGPLLSGMEREAQRHDLALVLQFADSEDELIGIYRRWWAGRHVDGIVMMNLVQDDPRLAAVTEIGLPAVLIGGPEGSTTLSNVAADEEEATTKILTYLWTLGHRRIARVAGPARYIHTQHRDRAFHDVLSRLPGTRREYRRFHTDYSSAEGADAIRQLLSLPDRPTAVVFDNDVMAAGALQVAAEMAIRVPDQLSIVSWDDSELCTIVSPTVTAMEQSPPLHAETAIKLLAETLAGEPIRHVSLPSARLTVRGSTAPPPESPPANRLSEPSSALG